MLNDFLYMLKEEKILKDFLHLTLFYEVQLKLIFTKIFRIQEQFRKWERGIYL